MNRTRWFNGTKEVPFHNGFYELKRQGRGNHKIIKLEIIDGKTAPIWTNFPIWGKDSWEWLRVRTTPPKSISGFYWRGRKVQP